MTAETVATDTFASLAISRIPYNQQASSSYFLALI
jgi:hypothetical protein